MGFRVIPIQRTPKYPRALSSCIMHTEPAAAEATSPIYRGAWLLSAAGRGPPRPRSLSLSLSLSPSEVFRVILFFVCDSIAPPLPPLSLLPVTPSALLLSRSPSPLIFSRGRILAPKRMTREDRALPRWNRAGAGEEHANTPST